MHWLFRVFQKYGNPRYQDDKTKFIASHVEKNHLNRFIDLSMEMVRQSEKLFISSKVLSYAIKISENGRSDSELETRDRKSPQFGVVS